MLRGKLLEPDRGREAGRAAADHDHVVFHGFARAELGEDFVVGHVGWIDNDFSRRGASRVAGHFMRRPRAIRVALGQGSPRHLRDSTGFKFMAYSIDLSGRVALVTGASSGLGAQFAKTLARAGAAVVLASRRVEKLKELRARIEGEGGDAMWSNST